jgi:hypothetical protein
LGVLLAARRRMARGAIIMARAPIGTWAR